ncbi:integral ER membrane protein Scs2 [Blumeria hordei DH14]|uniref:Integral ER membrane protein Scs2 n=1 Tax=Blumeria graminis f. sp. hordei (strain DH14) TaxID=546991 RepID=N1J5Z3_BLUG1|nr:integral ER membrane protein Scs2 [Blumeria hordei DH14]
MSIEIEPHELGFRLGPLTTEVAQVLKIINPNQTSVAFKVKTTAPKQYCVRPNSGKIEPGKNVEVIVTLQAMAEDPPMDVKCRDKFLVQSIAIAAQSEDSFEWPSNQASKTAIEEKKIRVVYLPRADSTSKTKSAVTPSKIAANSSSPDSSAYIEKRSPSPEAAHTPETRNGNQQFSAGQSPSEMKPFTTPLPNSENTRAKPSKSDGLTTGYTQDLNTRLRNSAKEKTVDGSGLETVHQVPQVYQGVPLHIVAALCLTSFLLAYILF